MPYSQWGKSNAVWARKLDPDMTVTHHWTIADLELLPTVDGDRYELIGGELHVSKQPHIHHQQVCAQVTTLLGVWSDETGFGQVIVAPGVIFSQEDAVAPDLIWISNMRFLSAFGEDGKLHQAPELMVEVPSAGGDNERRDREIKLSLYSEFGVLEYWLIDWRSRSIEVYRGDGTRLILAATLYGHALLETALLPGFSCEVERLFRNIPRSGK
jgi:Uma2 family endonuclease